MIRWVTWPQLPCHIYSERHIIASFETGWNGLKRVPCQDMPRYALICLKICQVHQGILFRLYSSDVTGTVSKQDPAWDHWDHRTIHPCYAPGFDQSDGRRAARAPWTSNTEIKCEWMCCVFFFNFYVFWWFLSIVMASGNWRMRLELQWLSCWGFQMMMREIGCDFWYFCSWFEGIRRDRRSARSTRLIDRAVQGTFEESPSSIQFQYVPILEPPMNDLNW